MRGIVRLALVGFLALGLLISACPGKYDSAPKADDKETGAMKERYKALLDEARKLEEGGEIDLLHHFSYAILTATKPEDFKTSAAGFIKQVKAGKFDDLDVSGGRAPGKVRLLLLSAAGNKGAIPLVKGAEGWKLDDIEAAFGKYDKELNIKGTAPASPPSALASLAVFQDPQASDNDKVQAAIDLAAAKDKDTATKYAGLEKGGWAKAALLYAVWKSGGACEPFAAAFPTAKEQQKQLYNSDTESYRTLLKGLTTCAGSSDKLAPMMQAYKGCHQVAGGARSEYVDPVVDMANGKPELLLKAALKAKIKYEEDPVANIVVGALHGEQKSPFYQFVTKHAAGRGKTAKLAKVWVEKMAARDELEPPGSEDGKAPTE